MACTMTPYRVGHSLGESQTSRARWLIFGSPNVAGFERLASSRQSPASLPLNSPAATRTLSRAWAAESIRACWRAQPVAFGGPVSLSGRRVGNESEH